MRAAIGGHRRRGAGIARGLLAALLLLAPPALAEPGGRPPFSAMGGLGAFISTGDGGGGLANAELDLSLRADARNVAGRVDFRLDYLGREGFVGLGLWLRDGDSGNAGVHRLRELSARIRLSSRARLSLGRVRTPGDFWLIVDGAKLEFDWAPGLTQAVYAGARAFTTGFRETHLTTDPTMLGLAGTSLDLRTRLVDAQLLFTWAQDRIDLSNQLQLPGGRLVLERHVEHDFFLQGAVSVRPTAGLLLLGGARLGTRFDVQWDAVTPFGATQLGSANLSAVSAWALVEWAPPRLDGRLRALYQLNYEHIRLFQSRLIGVGAGGLPVSAADGDFHDHALRVLGRPARFLQAEIGYRLRFRQNTDIEHHLMTGLRAHGLVGGLGLLGSVDVTVTSPAHIFFAPEAQTSARAVYAIAATWIDHRFDARLGVQYIDGYGSGLLSNPSPPPAVGQLRTLLFPYVLESNRIALASFFYSGERFFCGIDVEESLVSFQLRAMAQFGLLL